MALSDRYNREWVEGIWEEHQKGVKGYGRNIGKQLKRVSECKSDK